VCHGRPEGGILFCHVANHFGCCIEPILDVKLTKKDGTMAKRKKKKERDIEKVYRPSQFVSKLRRLADCIESGRRFRIQIAGERIAIPPDALINIEHEREGDQEEVEFQLKWSNPE
jgi:amphi-Trp domain-containing protein